MAFRVEAYLHSDSITPNKGGAIVKVSAQTDFATKTEGFINFCKQVAMVAFIQSAENWSDIKTNEVEYSQRCVEAKDALEKELKEKITVEKIAVIS